MEQVIKHYGNAILAVVVLLGLAAIVVVLLSDDGFIAGEFTELIQDFFENLSAGTRTGVSKSGEIISGVIQ